MTETHADRVEMYGAQKPPEVTETRRARLEALAAAWRETAELLEPDDLPVEDLIALASAARDVYATLCIQIAWAGGRMPVDEEYDEDDELDDDEDGF
jgi:hypothetical protein